MSDTPESEGPNVRGSRGADLVAALRGPSPRYKRAEMEAAHSRFAECEPHLVAVVAEAAADPARFAEVEGPGSLALHYCLHLLARAGARSAHEPLLRLLAHPEETTDTLLGDAVTEDLGTWLFATSDGEIEGIVGLVLDRRAGEWVRGAAVLALVLIGDSNPEVREEVVATLRARLVDHAEPGVAVVTAAIDGLVRLGDRESYDAMVAAIDEWELGPFDYTVEDVDRGLARYPGAGEYAHAKRQRYLPLGRLHASLEWWASFEENRGRSIFGSLARDTAAQRQAAALARRKAAKRKANNKAQKKARRAGRKRR